MIEFSLAKLMRQYVMVDTLVSFPGSILVGSGGHSEDCSNVVRLIQEI
jgi:hypothetical protein